MYERYVLKGNDYELGLKAGEIFKDPINKEIDKYLKMLDDEKTSLQVDKIINKIKNDLPRCLDEIYGRADGANVDRRALVLFYSPEVYTKLDACTTAIYKKDDRVLFSHNEDDYDCNHENRKLFKIINDDFYLFGMGDYHRLNGSNFGYNSYGLVFSCNYLFHKKVNLDNLSRYIVSRYIFEAKNIEDLLNRIKNNKPASPFSINVMDINTNEVLNIENDINDMYITRINGKYARSNHFLNKENPKMTNNSYYRNKFANERITLLNESSNLEDLRNVLNYEDEEYEKSIFMDPIKYKDLDNTTTIANFSFDSKDREVMIFDGLDHTYLEFPYEHFEDNLK